MERAEKYKSVIIESIKNKIPEIEIKKVESRMLLALKIKEVMQKKGISNVKLAKILNKKTPQISKWLSGTHNLTHDTICEIQEAIDVSLINNKEKIKLVSPQFNLQLKVESGKKSTTPNSVANQMIINDLSVNIGKC